MDAEPLADRNRHPSPWALAALVLLIVLVRSLWLSRLGLHLDEDISTLAARGIARTGLPELPSGHLYWRAPLFHYLIAPLAAPGIDWLPRLLTVALAAVTGVILARGAAVIAGPRAAWAGAIVYALSITEIAIARQIRMYMLFQPLALIAVLLVWRFWASGALRWAWASALVMLAAVTTQELAATLALLYVPVAIRHPRPRVWAFAGGAIAAFGALNRIEKRILDATFCGGLPRVPEHAPPQGMAEAPFRAMLTADPLALGRAVLGPAGLVIAALAGVLIAALVVGREAGDRPPLARVAAAALLAAALAAAACGLPGIAVAILALVVLQRGDLLPGAAGARALAVVAALVGAIALGWIAIGLGRGAHAPDLVLGLSRWPWRFARMLLWPPAIAVAAGLAALWVARRAWRGDAPGGIHFLTLAIAWMVLTRGALGDRAQVRYVVDVWPLWELLAAWGAVTFVAWSATVRKDPTFYRVAGLVTIALLLPGTSPRDIAAFLARGPGDRSAVADRLDSPAADLRGAAAWLAPRLAPGDAIVATDWISTCAYTGHVDGWLRSNDYGPQSTAVDGVPRDCYLGARVLPDRAALEAFAAGRTVWVIAGGQELASDNDLLSPELRAWLTARPAEFVAADRETRVIRLGPSH
jgi:hypothetical protein